MSLSDFLSKDTIFAAATLVSAIAAVLAWAAKLLWAKELKEAKDEMIRAKQVLIDTLSKQIEMLRQEKEEQLQTLRMQIENVSTFNPTTLKGHFESLRSVLDEKITLLEHELTKAQQLVKEKQDKINLLQERHHEGSLRKMLEEKHHLETELQKLSGQLKREQFNREAVDKTFELFNKKRIDAAYITEFQLKLLSLLHLSLPTHTNGMLLGEIARIYEGYDLLGIRKSMTHLLEKDMVTAKHIGETVRYALTSRGINFVEGMYDQEK